MKTRRSGPIKVAAGALFTAGVTYVAQGCNGLRNGAPHENKPSDDVTPKGKLGRGVLLSGLGALLFWGQNKEDTEKSSNAHNQAADGYQNDKANAEFRRSRL